MLAFRDFHSRVGALLPSDKQVEEYLNPIVDQINAWVARDAIRVLNVETIGIFDGLYDARFLRVWYHAAEDFLESSGTQG